MAQSFEQLIQRNRILLDEVERVRRELRHRYAEFVRQRELIVGRAFPLLIHVSARQPDPRRNRN